VSDVLPRLRFVPPDAPFHVVLVEPEIPQNTGSIGRLCVATGSRLHLVGRLGFDISSKAVRRAGLDYWKRLDPSIHTDLDACLGSIRPTATIVLTANASRPYLEAPFAPGAAIVLGGESRGLPRSVLEAHAGSLFGIPTIASVRSLNLAGAAAVVLYEALRVTGALSSTFLEDPSSG
jgi:tRNA (cytidine/uridine-2'-O-)-methyltransferase